MKQSFLKFSQKVVGEAGVRLLATLFVLVLARRIGAESFGEYSTALAYAALCIVFVDLGTNAILTRDVARHPAQRVVIATSSHVLKLAAAVVSWVILYALTRLLKFSPEKRFITLGLGVVVIGQTMTEYFSALLSGIEEMGWEAILKIVSRSMAVIFGLWSLVLKQPLHSVVAHMVIGTGVAYGMGVAIVRARYRGFGLGYNSPFLISLLKSCLPLFGSVLFWILYDSQDVLVLNYFHFPSRDIGLFSAAMKVMDVTRVYPVLMMGVFFPTLSKLHLTDSEAFLAKRKKVLLFIAGSLLFVAGVVYLLAPYIIQLLYKSDYEPASKVLRLLAPSLVFMGLNHVQMQLLIAVNRERSLLVGALFVCAINLGSALFLVPRYGLVGTCYSLLFSEALYFVFLRRTLTTNA